jgi:hypothetical protein
MKWFRKTRIRLARWLLGNYDDLVADYELATSEELIHEIVNRSTFQGIIIRTKEPCKTREYDTRDFRIDYARLTDGQIYNLLRKIINKYEEREGDVYNIKE